MVEPIPFELDGALSSGGDRPGEQDTQLTFLEELVEEHATVAGDVIEIDAHTWAIHGSIAMDGEVIMAEYESEEHARTVLEELSVVEHEVDGL